MVRMMVLMVLSTVVVARPLSPVSAQQTKEPPKKGTPTALLKVGGRVDLANINRTIGKEPNYTGKPRYCLLVFGADAKHRVWLVQDGNTLYVDRNGNGDLTEADEKVTAKKLRFRDAEGAFEFEVGELRLGGKTHKGLEVSVFPLKILAVSLNLLALPQVGTTVRKNPDGVAGMVALDVECASLKGAGIGGRVPYLTHLYDTSGVLQFANKPADAPIIHFDGPLEVTFFGSKPTWTGGRAEDAILCVGSPGSGPGTFAMLKYEGTIPEGKHPKIEATFRTNDDGAKSVKELYELKERC
jgi:hypothetical protein